MLTAQQLEQELQGTEEAALHPLIRQQVVPLKSNVLFQQDLRLDAGYYTRDIFLAQIAISNFDTTPLERYCEPGGIFMPGRAKRILTDDSQFGKPFLLPSEFFNFPLRPTKYVLYNKLPDREKFLVKSDWLMVTRSGVVGLPVFVTKKYERFVISDDAIRIVPKPKTRVGYLYGFILTPIGQALLTRNQFGVAVEHIQPHQVDALQIPVLDDELELLFDEFMRSANAIRQDAEALLAKAHKKMLDTLELSPVADASERRTRHFTVKSTALDMRLDASYQEPETREMRNLLKHKKARRLGEGLAKTFLPNRFRRIYVSSEYGVPFLQGGNIVQCKLFGLQNISRRMTKNLASFLIRKDWTLVTRSGTVGRACLVPSRWDGWAASEHIFRVIPNKEMIHPGYLAGFLISLYGQMQLTSRIYGGVVDEITADDVDDVLVPLPGREEQTVIGEMITRAYALKEVANVVEDQTVATLNSILLGESKTEKAKELEKSLKQTIGILLDYEFSSPLTGKDFENELIRWTRETT
jgi:type I restriction enzyme S subunit